MNSNQPNYSVTTVSIQSRLLAALKQPIITKCNDLHKLIEETINTNSKEIHAYFSLLVEDIFGFGSQSTDGSWNLKSISRLTHPYEFNAVYNFLYTGGPLFRFIKNLMADPLFKCDFPVSCLPLPSKLMIDEGLIPSFYLNRLSSTASSNFQQRTYTNASLNALEFYLFHFSYYIKNDFRGQMNIENLNSNLVNASSVMYIALLETYLGFFLPLEPISSDLQMQQSQSFGHQSLWQSLSSTTSHLIDHLKHSPVSSRHLEMSNDNSPGVTPFFKSDLLNLKPFINSRANKNDCPHHRLINILGSEAMKCELMINILSEMWLNINVPVSQLRKYQGSNQMYSHFVPNADHMRCVRIFIKHLHYFSNSMDQEDSALLNNFTEHSEVDEIKRSVWTNRFMVQRMLYTFLRLSFEHWPLDSSLRLPLETWLSYIQPWRYVDPKSDKFASSVVENEENMSSLSNSCNGRVNIRWKHFISDNLLFYSMIFRQIISRLSRMDLLSTKNLFMLFRIIKIFSQNNLAELIRECEDEMADGKKSDSSATPTRVSLLSPSIKSPYNCRIQSSSPRHLIEYEEPGFVYIPLFSVPMKTQIAQLLISISKAKTEISEVIKYHFKERQSKNNNLFARIMSFVWGDATTDAEECQTFNDRVKAENYLTVCLTKFCGLFDLDIPDLNNYSSKIDPYNDSPTLNKKKPLSCITPGIKRQAEKFTDQMRTQSFPESEQNKIPDNLNISGNPDIQPVRSFEVAFLVWVLISISTFINQKYSHKFEQLYDRNDIIGKFSTLIFWPPISYLRIQKNLAIEPPRTVVEKLPARINLRFFANKMFLLYLVVFMSFFYYIGFSYSFLILTFLLSSVSRSIFEACSEYRIQNKYK